MPAKAITIDPEDDGVLTMNEPLVTTTTGGRPAAGVTTEFTWKDLVQLESRRREVLQRADLPFLQILSHVDGTCLGALSSDKLLWLTMTIFVSIRMQVWWFGALPEFARGFLSFFLVFFVNQANARFTSMFQESMNCIKRIYDVASIVATAFPKPHAHRIVRYMNAAHALGYAGLSSTYSYKHFIETSNQKYSLLTKAELFLVQDILEQSATSIPGAAFGPDAMQEVAEWCMKDVDLAYRTGIIEVKDFAALRDKVLALRGSMNTLYEYNDQPILFFYVHFTCLLSALYLPLFAISNAYKAGAGSERHWSADLLAGLIVLVQCVFVIGLRMLARKMVDPFGSDLEDLSVLRYVKTAWQRSNRLLATRFPGKVDVEVEEQMVRSRKETIGQPWKSSMAFAASTSS